MCDAAVGLDSRDLHVQVTREREVAHSRVLKVDAHDAYRVGEARRIAVGAAVTPNQENEHRPAARRTQGPG